MSKPKKIIGIDPGTNILGYAVIEIVERKEVLHSLGVIHLKKYGDHYEKLKKIFEKVSFLVKTHQPDDMAIEAPFFGKNVQSMLKLGRAQGVAIAAAMMQNVAVYEYSPRKIKQSITGNGNASKEQLSLLLKNRLQLEKMPQYFDATDALGVAVCHYLQSSSPLFGLQKQKKYKNWSDFLKDNPDKIR